ncbi:MAG TPA: hypothetical protein VE618_01630 [Myxococcaceae bacterium]|nr:hypothetical protein [Myxococcaceae bacterium]
MTKAWQRRRAPEDVPTPVAVAVSDFCRRAGAPASPFEIREALALLSDDEDFRVRALTDGEPRATPLGPWAVVDVLRGTSEELAATRQSCGYYDLVRVLAVPPAPAQSTATPPAAVAPPLPVPATAPTVTKRKQKASEPTLAERIAPKKRAREEAAAMAPVPALEPEHPVAREGARPKGRFAQLTPQLQSVDDLFTPEARDALAARLQQYPDRFALTRALGDQYGGRREGQPLRTEDLERALRHHGLLEALEHREREAILGAYSEQRGATSKVAFALGLTVPELNRLIHALGIPEQIEEIRERFRREALSPKHLSARLDLLGRGKYLSDLGIRRRFDDALKGDLRALLHKHAPRAGDAGELLEIAARYEATQPELLARALERLGLSDEVRKLYPDQNRDHTPYAT